MIAALTVLEGHLISEDPVTSCKVRHRFKHMLIARTRHYLSLNSSVALLYPLTHFAPERQS